MKIDKFYIKFEHIYDNGAQIIVDDGKLGLETPISGATICKVYGDGEEPLGSATAYCSLKDQFDKRIGRKVSLGRALRNARIPKEDRAKVWAEYLAR